MAVQLEEKLTRRRFTVDEYHRIGEAGVFGPDERIELIAGEIVQMTPVGRRHVACVGVLLKMLITALGDRAVVWSQSPIRLASDFEPLPDVLVLRPGPYRERDARADDVVLLIEVADTSIAHDRGIKRARYAAAGIDEYWIVDLEGEALEVYRPPVAEGYRESVRFARGSHVTLGAFSDVSLRVDDILG